MFTLYFWSNIAFILLIYLPMHFSDAKRTVASGPYRIILTKVGACEKPSRPYVKDPPISVTLKLHNTSNHVLLNGNFSVLRDTRNMKNKMRNFIYEHGKWKTNFIMNDIGCHSLLLHYICVAAGIKYDRRTCMFYKGHYTFDNLDPNYIQHLMTPKMEYANMMWIHDSYNQQQETILCLEFHSVVEPI